jgi:hypothetical protein
MKPNPVPPIASFFQKQKESLGKYFKSSSIHYNNDFFSEGTTGRSASFFDSNSHSNSIPTLQGSILFVLFSFSLSEVLSWFGLFQDSRGLGDQERAKEFGRRWFPINDQDEFQTSRDEYNGINFEEKMEICIDSFRLWCSRSRKKGGIFHLPTWRKRLIGLSEAFSLFGVYDTFHTVFSFKHQFAIGCSLGMIFQQTVKMGLNIGLGVYVFSEIIYNIQKAGEEFKEHDERIYTYSSDDENDGASGYPFDQSHLDMPSFGLSNAVSIVLDRLDQVRVEVRRILSSIQSIDSTNHHWYFDDSEGTAIVGAIVGIILKSLV